MREPVEIEDEGHERILERVAAVDVAKASGVVCTRVPDTGRAGRRRTRAWAVSASTSAIAELAQELAAAGIEKVTLEATSDYWRIWVRREAHCRMARSAGRNWRRCSWI